MTGPRGVTLAILAGGQGTRMGRPKALLDIAGRPILSWLLSRFAWPGPTLLVTAPAIARPPGAAEFDRHAIDPVDGNGPLQGVLTALRHATTPLTAIVTVDMPGVGPDQLSWLIDQVAGDAARTGVMCRREVGEHSIEPFPCVLRAVAIDTVDARLSAGRRSVFGLCDTPGIDAVPSPCDWPAETWLNLNYPGEFAAFARSLDRQGP